MTKRRQTDRSTDEVRQFKGAKRKLYKDINNASSVPLTRKRKLSGEDNYTNELDAISPTPKKKLRILDKKNNSINIGD
jgi:hypothetical protein